MNEERKELELQLGRQVLDEVIGRLKELQAKHSCFATAAASDSVRAFEKLFRNHSNFREEDIELALGVVSVSLFNAATDLETKVEYEQQ